MSKQFPDINWLVLLSNLSKWRAPLLKTFWFSCLSLVNFHVSSKKVQGLFKQLVGRGPRCGGLSLSPISSVFPIHAWAGWVGGIKIWTDSGCQWRLRSYPTGETTMRICDMCAIYKDIYLPYILGTFSRRQM